jgi:hypothetical protein
VQCLPPAQCWHCSVGTESSGEDKDDRRVLNPCFAAYVLFELLVVPQHGVRPGGTGASTSATSPPQEPFYKVYLFLLFHTTCLTRHI